MPRRPPRSIASAGMPLPSSVDRHDEVVGIPVQHDRGAGRRGVAHDVGERLLHDAVGGRLDGARRQVARRGGRRARPRGPRPDPLRGERRQLRELRLRRERCGRGRRLVAAQERQHAAHLVEPGGAERADVRERLAGPLGLAVEEVQTHAGLHRDLAQRMGEHVVQLAGDAGALLLLAGDAPLGQLRAARRAVLEPRADALADPEAQRERERGERDAERMPAGAEHPARDDGGQPRGADRDERPQPCAAHDGADDREGQGDEGRAGVGRHEQIGRGERGDDGDGQARASAARARSARADAAASATLSARVRRRDVAARPRSRSSRAPG